MAVTELSGKEVLTEEQGFKKKKKGTIWLSGILCAAIT
jgi:hypothetical protein